MSLPFTALIPLKEHSLRVPGKNLRLIAGRPLFHWVCLALRNSESVGTIAIDTDSDTVEAAVRDFDNGISILRRPEQLQGDDVSVNLLIEWQMSQLPGDRFLQTHATSPLLSAETLDAGISAFDRDDAHDSLFTVTRHQVRMYHADGRPINHNPDELLQTQDLPPVYEENSCFYVFTRQSFAAANRRIGLNPMMYEIGYPDDVDIDEETDFKRADYLLSLREGLLPENGSTGADF